MRILLLTPFVPDAAAPAGCPRAVFDRLCLLAPRHDVTVVCFATPSERAGRTAVEQLGVRLVVVGRPADQDAGSPAARARRRWGKRARLGLGLARAGRPGLVQEFGSRQLVAAVRRELTEHRPDLVLVEHVLMAQYLSAVPVDLPAVVSDHDVQLAHPPRPTAPPRPRPPGSPAAVLERFERFRWRRYAAAAYRRASAVLVPTEQDAVWVSGWLPDVRPVVVPFGAVVPPDPDAAGEDDAPVRRREDMLLFVGNYAHPPNRDAAVWLAREILPAVWRHRPQAELHLVGAGLTSEIETLAAPRVVVTGAVPSVRPYLRSCTVFVAALRAGGGTRMKVIEALAAGAPVVSTTVGVAGLPVTAGRDVLVGDTTDEFAARVLEALADPELRGRVAAAGRRALDADPSRRAEHLDGVLAQVLR